MNKTKVIWGAGAMASRQIAAMTEEISFIIDSDLQKKCLLGKDVIHPQNIRDWSSLFVYIPNNYYEEISSFLVSKGLIEGLDFTQYNANVFVNMDKLETDMDASIDELMECVSKFRQKSIFFIGSWIEKNIYSDVILKLLENGVLFNIILEAYWCEKKEIEQKFNTYVLKTPIVYDNMSVPLNGYVKDERKNEINSIPYLYNTVKQIYNSSKKVNIESCYYTVSCIHKFQKKLLEYIKPKIVFCFDSVIPSHMILRNLCIDKDISVIFTHPGVIPGTVAFDVSGEVGESLPTVYEDAFQQLPVSEYDLEKAKTVWKYLYTSKLNRKVQPINNCIKRIKKRVVKSKPILFFAGQNDVYSHMVPYTESTLKYYSPIFKSSTEAAIYLANICEKNDWNFIYKPHPQYTQPEQVALLPSNTIFVEFGDINDLIDISDVTVTILSTTNYNALIRYKPVVMLGYNQTRGKGCTYEAFSEDKIESAIKEALEKGFTQEQQEAFLRHMAQCLKYYLYDDLQKRPIRYGKPVPKSVEEFYELERLLKY